MHDHLFHTLKQLPVDLRFSYVDHVSYKLLDL